MTKTVFRADTTRSIDGTAITDTYADIGDALTKVWVQMVIKNSSNETVFISENGIDNHYELPPLSSESYDFQSNYPGETLAGKAVGTQFKIKANSGAIPTTGRVIIQGQYL